MILSPSLVSLAEIDTISMTTAVKRLDALEVGREGGTARR
jgi:hypothetical protein